MRHTKRKLLLLWSFCMCVGVVVSAQENFTGLNDSVINLNCSQTCASLKFKVPHLKTSEDYQVVSIPFKPYAFTTTGGTELVELYADDEYSDAINLPFPICFYGQTFNQVVVGSNGLITFDASNADCFNAYTIIPTIPSAGTGIPCAIIQGDQQLPYYPRAAIMAAFSDLMPKDGPADRKIEWRFEGVAPFRRFIASWNKVGVYSANNPTCSMTTPATFQIVVNEATSVIDVYIAQKICTDASEGKAILGIQNWNRDKAVAAPGKNSTLWTAQKEAYRFIPSGSTSRFIKAELVNYTSGVVMEMATVTETTPGYKDISFSDKCPAGNSEKYIIRTTYSSICDPATPIIVNDTITVNKGVLPFTTSVSKSGCAVGTGSITATVTTGAGVAGPYMYQLNPGAITINSPDPTATFNNLTPGFYNLTVTGAGSCSQTISNIEVLSSGTFDVSYVVNPPSCVGAQNASIVLTPPAGGGPYSYSINGSPVTNIITGLPASGPYQLEIWTSPTCKAFVTVPMIPAGTGVLTGTVAPTATTCLGVNNGTLTATPTSGSGPYQYSIDNGQTWQSANTFNNLAAGNYNVLIREGACTSLPLPASIPAGAGLNVSLTSNPASCSGARDGNLAVNITTGTAPYTVSITGAITFTQTITTNVLVVGALAPGEYFVSVSDANGCSPATNPGKVTVGAGTGFNVTTASVPVSCFGGNNGSLSITPSAPAGTSPYTFTLNGTITQTGATNAAFNGLTAGNYSVLVRDAVGCEVAMSNVVVTQPAVLAIPPPAIQTPLCNGDDNGMITVNPTGGNPPYTYSLNGSAFQPANTFKVSAGSYSVRVLDSKNCGALYSNITVAAPPVLSATVSGTTNATCEGGANGSITITAAGGSGNYQYSSGGGVFQSSNVLNVIAGIYTVTVKDVNGCLFTIPGVTVGLTNNLSFTPVADPPPICEGASTSLQLTTNATSFSWTPSQPGVVNDASVASPVVHPSVTTLFQVTMRLGICTAQDEVNVQVMPAPVANAGPDGEICFGQNYQLQASGGIRYEWTPQRFLSDPFNSSPQVLQPDRTIIYSVTTTDANNCSSLAPDEITITVIPPIKIKVSPADTVVYAGDRFQLTASSIASNYTWTPATGLSNAFIADPVVTAPSFDGAVVQYDVTASTAAGCKGEGQAIVRVYKGPAIYVANAFSPNNDGKNDVFIPFPVGIKQLKYFRVFNRWGQMLFSTTTLQQGWDGRFGGLEQPGGVYTWMVEAITHDDRKITKKGTVTLIR